MSNSKPTVHKIAEASNGKYEIIEYHGVEVLIRRSALETAIELSVEWTHDKVIEELAKECGIRLRRFR